MLMKLSVLFNMSHKNVQIFNSCQFFRFQLICINNCRHEGNSKTFFYTSVYTALYYQFDTCSVYDPTL